MKPRPLKTFVWMGVAVILSLSIFLVFRSKTKLFREFAGKYYLGDGLGMNCHVVVEHAGRFRFYWYTDSGVYQEHQGDIAIHDSVFILTLDFGSGNPPFCFSERLVPVSWGERKYLIHPVSSFCEQVINALEPRDMPFGTTYLRITDVDMEILGDPMRADGQPQCP